MFGFLRTPWGRAGGGGADGQGGVAARGKGDGGAGPGRSCPTARRLTRVAIGLGSNPRPAEWASAAHTSHTAGPVRGGGGVRGLGTRPW